MSSCRFKRADQSPNVGGIGLGFKDKASSMRGFVASSSGNLSTTNSPAPAPAAKGPATDRLSAMKEAFKAQYINQVSQETVNFFFINAFIAT